MKGGDNMKKQWQNPTLEVLSIDQTMASGHWGGYDEGYDASKGEEGQTGPHHVS